jgi:hypothetical protein
MDRRHLGQFDDERAADPFATHDENGAAIRFYDAPHGCEAQPETWSRALPRTNEGLEDGALHSFRYPRPSVFDLDANTPAA